MSDVIAPAPRCETCGTYLSAPADGQWRWAKGEKTYPTLLQAEEAAARIRLDGWEFRAAEDPEGRVRIASRRVP
jgi:hypothetical protein